MWIRWSGTVAADAFQDEKFRQKRQKVERALAGLKPRDPLVQILRRARARHVVAQLSGDAARVMKFAVHRCQ
jgi:adenylosuccinate lyase